jgi:hypothetical protein
MRHTAVKVYLLLTIPTLAVLLSLHGVASSSAHTDGPVASGVVGATSTPTTIPTATATTCPTGAGYVITTSPATIITATTDIGNHCNDCTTTIGLPFPVQLMDGQFTIATVGSNGVLHFVGGTNSPQNVCLPAAGVSYTIMPHWDDLRTDGVNGGIFTSVLGSAPNRTFLIEWRARYAQSGNPVSFEVLLPEGENRFDIIYGLVPEEGMSTTVGVQRDPARYTEYWCNSIPLRSYYRVTFNYQSCLTPTVVATNSPTATSQSPTSTSVQSSTATATVQASATHTPTLTPQPTSCGLAWRPVPNPLGGTLHGVHAIAPDDVWVVGENGTVHWNGVGWVVVPNPIGGVRDISAVSSDDIWAVGPGGIIHWDGSEWSLSYSAAGVGLSGVKALSPTDAWAVGSGPTCYWRCTFTLRWDGTSWEHVPSPTPGNRGDFLDEVEALSGDVAWAVGTWIAPSFFPLLLRWDGTDWLNESPGVGSTAMLADVSATAPNDAWVVGSIIYPLSSLILHFDGSQWIQVGSPNIDALFGVAVLSTNHAWAVGDRGILRWNGSAWSQDAASEDPLRAIDALSPTDAWAVGELIYHYSPALFIDVPPNHTFYPFIQCLACRGIVSGYADGTFRPGESVTRGQLSKIVSNAAGFNEDPGPQIYEDVPAGHTFYVSVNRLSMRGIVRGYQCGGQGEPCVPPGNRPYFRPQANATRGQVAQIVCMAWGCQEPFTGQTYEDVPPTNPFWAWIERLTLRGIVTGYPCGGPGEPCVPPGNRPYFRWAITATRGQVSKIVANTFLPGCEVP